MRTQAVILTLAADSRHPQFKVCLFFSQRKFVNNITSACSIKLYAFATKTQIISPPLLRLSKRSLLIRAQPQDFTQRRQSGKNVKSQKVKGGNLEPTTKLDGKIALALRVVGTNFAAFFVTCCDKFCLLLNQKHLIFSQKV